MRTLIYSSLSFVLAVIFAGMLDTARQSVPTFEHIMRAEAAPTVRLLEGANGSCSAVVIAPGYAFTALHCKQVIDPKVDGHPVAEWREYSAKDVAVVKVPGLTCPCAATAAKAPAGERVSAIGFPYTVGLLLSYGESQGDVIYDDETYLHHTAITMPGMSGGGVFSLRRGRVWLVAITSKASSGSTLSVSVDGLQPELKGF